MDPVPFPAAVPIKNNGENLSYRLRASQRPMWKPVAKAVLERTHRRSSLPHAFASEFHLTQLA